MLDKVRTTDAEKVKGRDDSMTWFDDVGVAGEQLRVRYGTNVTTSVEGESGSCNANEREHYGMNRSMTVEKYWRPESEYGKFSVPHMTCRTVVARDSDFQLELVFFLLLAPDIAS